MVVGTARESRLGAGSGARGERREKLHPFESHLRTPSGLKKSIKRREARHGGRQPGGGGWKGLKKREKEYGGIAGGPASRLLCQVDEAGKDEKTDGERRNLQ